MEVIHLDKNTKLPRQTVVTIGNFDGVHLGHHIVIEKLVCKAKQLRVSSAIITFLPHTREVIKGEEVMLLSTLEEKTILLEQFEVDYLIVVSFDDSIVSLSKEQFKTEVLEKQLNCVEIIMGEDHRFGKKSVEAKKDTHSADEKSDISAVRIKLYGENGISVSSTEVRRFLQSGLIDNAVNMLGRPYLILGERIRGERIGTKLGYPTLNFMSPPAQKIVPPAGVYVAEIEYGTQRLKGCLYYGDCPTFGNRSVHFEFFSLDLIEVDPQVGEMCQIWVHHFVRENMKFSSSDELVKQIVNDVATIKSYFTKG